MKLIQMIVNDNVTNLFKVLDFMNKNHTWITSKDIINNMQKDKPDINPQTIRGNISRLFRYSLLKRKHEEGTRPFLFKINTLGIEKINSVRNNSDVNSKQYLSKSIMFVSDQNNITEIEAKLHKRIHDLLEHDVKLPEIQLKCFSALEDLWDSICDNILEDEIKYLKEHNFSILPKYLKLEAEIIDLKDMLKMLNDQKHDK